MKKKERLDVMLVERGLIETREKAKRAIMAGLVYSEQERLDKPGQKVEITIPIELKGNPLPYVSRGGLKLEKALETFHFDVKDKIMIDIGSSTGGFTDCALQNGAQFVYAVDVGYNQLDWKLRSDSRVRVMERTNFRYSKPEDFDNGLPHVATIDVSFISLKLILPVLKEILVHNGEVVALIKPQFEAGREEVGKKGIVRDRKIHQAVIDRMIKFSHETGYHVLDCTYSPIRGGEGNIEFLLHLRKPDKYESSEIKWTGNTETVVNEAHVSKKD